MQSKPGDTKVFIGKGGIDSDHRRPPGPLPRSCRQPPLPLPTVARTPPCCRPGRGWGQTFRDPARTQVRWTGRCCAAWPHMPALLPSHPARAAAPQIPPQPAQLPSPAAVPLPQASQLLTCWQAAACKRFTGSSISTAAGSWESACYRVRTAGLGWCVRGHAWGHTCMHAPALHWLVWFVNDFIALRLMRRWQPVPGHPHRSTAGGAAAAGAGAGAAKRVPGPRADPEVRQGALAPLHACSYFAMQCTMDQRMPAACAWFASIPAGDLQFHAHVPPLAGAAWRPPDPRTC